MLPGADMVAISGVCEGRASQFDCFALDAVEEKEEEVVMDGKETEVNNRNESEKSTPSVPFSLA